MRLVILLAGALMLAGCPTEEPRLPRAAFTASPAGGTSPVTVQFTDLSTPGDSPIVAWYWNFGDAQTGTGQNPTHTFVSVGRYSITMRVITAIGEDVATREKFIEVLAPQVGPQAHFSADVFSGEAPLTVTFVDDSVAGSRPVTTWRWDFGDGERSTFQNPTHTYAAPGVYTVSLDIANSIGEDTYTEPGLITVFD